MGVRTDLLLLLATFMTLAAFASSHVIYVNNDGVDEPGCLANGDSHCKTLDYAVTNITNSTWVVLLSERNTLNSCIDITRFNNISIISNLSAVIDCDGEGSYETERVGLYFASGSNLMISNITFVHCGCPRLSTKYTTGSDHHIISIWAALYVLNTTDLVIESCKFSESRGTGVVLYDVNGIVSITDTDFNHAHLDNTTLTSFGGGGLYIEHTSCTPGLFSCNQSDNPYNSNSNYTVHSCKFENNTVSRIHSDSLQDQMFGSTLPRVVGGGMSFTPAGESSDNSLTISNCSFLENRAESGGGLEISLRDGATNNRVLVEGVLVQGNAAENLAGGGIRVSFIAQSSNNTVVFTESTFSRNTASVGGGAELYSTPVDMVTNSLVFQKCLWFENSGQLAAAVNIAPTASEKLSDGFIITPVFEDCTFSGNTRRVLTTPIGKPPLSITRITTAAMYIDSSVVNLTGSIAFTDNNCRGIYMNGGTINVLESTSIIFARNNASYGGALLFTGFSVLYVFPHTELNFTENRVTEVGGAICSYSADQIDFIYSRSCFIQYHNTSVSPDNWTDVNFYFNNNKAGYYGDSIFTSSLFPCSTTVQSNGNTPDDAHTIFHWKPFHYSDNDTGYNIATDPSTVAFENVTTTNTVSMSPGEVYNLSLVATDELGQRIVAVYKSLLTRTRGHAKIDKTYQYISDNGIRIFGEINATFRLIFEVVADHRKRIFLNVQLGNCPPGYVYSATKMECICSATTETEQYAGIIKCSDDQFKAYLEEGYWAGCRNEDKNLITGRCSPGYCSYDAAIAGLLAMPKSCAGLDEVLCGPQRRTGALCGRCIDGLTVFYHSERYACKKCTTGFWGLLIYVAAELLPLTILFILIMLFNIRLTSGSALSFLLFVQVMDFISSVSVRSVNLPFGVDVITTIIFFVFGFLNLDILRLDAISFCLWDRATVLDNLVFKYVTTLYALLFIVLLVWVLRCCPFKQISKLWRESPVHGISTFILVTYTQCAKVSFQILTLTDLKTQGMKTTQNVILLSGDVSYFSLEHAPYAAAALLVVLLLCLLPMLLLMHPAIDQLAGRYLRRSNFPSFFLFRRLKPLLDSFQGSYKDRYRYFAGIAFLERLAFAAAFAFSNTRRDFFTSIISLTVVILFCHACAQPFAKRRHNVIDLFFLANLAIINILSWNNSEQATIDSETSSNAILYIQVLLLCLPIAYLTILLVVKLA